MVNENEINKNHWNPLTKKQENTFGFTKKEEIINFAKNIIRKHAPEELRNYPVEIRWFFKRNNWANIAHINAEPQYNHPDLNRNRILLSISTNLLHPDIPLFFKKESIVHEVTHLFSQRSHLFYDPKTKELKMDPKRRLKEGFDSDKKIYDATEGHPQEYADQYHKLLKDILGIDVNKFPQFKYIAGKTEKEYKEIAKHKDLLNVWHRHNFIFIGQVNGWLGLSQNDFNDYIKEGLSISKKVRKKFSEMKINLKNERIENNIKNNIKKHENFIERLKKHQLNNKNFTWDRQNAIDKIKNEKKKWEELYNQRKAERKILEAEEKKRKEIELKERQKKYELWKTNPPDKNDDDYWEYENWKERREYDQKIKLTSNQLEQDIKKYMELKNSNQEISQDLKKRIGDNLWKFHHLTDKFYEHPNIQDLRNDEDLIDIIEEYEEMKEDYEDEEDYEDYEDDEDDEDY